MTDSRRCVAEVAVAADVVAVVVVVFAPQQHFSLPDVRGERGERGERREREKRERKRRCACIQHGMSSLAVESTAVYRTF